MKLLALDKIFLENDFGREINDKIFLEKQKKILESNMNILALDKIFLENDTGRKVNYKKLLAFETRFFCNHLHLF